MSPVLGLCIACCWGLADVQSSRTHFPFMNIAVIAQGFGFLTLTIVGMFWLHATLLTDLSFVAGTGLGLLFFLGLLSALSYFCLYRALHLAHASSIGTISTIIAANAGVTVLFSCVGTAPDWRQLSTIGLMLSGIVIITKRTLPARTSAQQQTRIPSGILWALAASLCLGTFNFGVGMLEQHTHLPLPDTFLILLGIRAFSFLVLALFLAMHAPTPEPQTHHRPQQLFRAASTGMLEALGLLLFSVATQTANVGIIATLASCSILVPLGYGFLTQRDTLSLPALGGFGLIFLSFLRLSFPALAPEIVFSWTLCCTGLLLLPTMSRRMSPAIDALSQVLLPIMLRGRTIPAIETYPTIEIQRIHGIVQLKTTHTTQALPRVPSTSRARATRQIYPSLWQEQIAPYTPSLYQKNSPQIPRPSPTKPSVWIMLSFILSLLLMTLIVGLALFSSFPVTLPW